MQHARKPAVAAEPPRSQIAKRASRSRARSAFCGSQSTSYRPATNCIVELKSRVPRAIAYGTAELIKPKNTPATRPVVNAPRVGAEEPQHQADEKPQPGAGDHTTAEHLRPGQATGDPFDLHQVDSDDCHLLHRESSARTGSRRLAALPRRWGMTRPASLSAASAIREHAGSPPGCQAWHREPVRAGRGSSWLHYPLHPLRTKPSSAEDIGVRPAAPQRLYHQHKRLVHPARASVTLG